ncbi:MAG: T9SS type A sorting domain-containing protein [Bacteroidetes bacterium]|nr:T9SS type A sorting domain-containing protein [Bacteroidota bacterium]
MKTKIGLLVILLLECYAISFAQNYGWWQQVDSLNEARYNHSSILLANGNVLVVGGAVEGNAKSCEIYHVDTGHWTEAAQTHLYFGVLRLVLLNSNRVLAVGSTRTKFCEIYNPGQDSWAVTDSLKTARTLRLHQAVKLLDGRVIVIGGDTFGYLGSKDSTLKSCEIYDEIIGKWSLADSMKTRRSSHSATLLKDGRVLVAGGGISPNSLSSCEIYDPVLNKWSNAAPMNIPRESHSAVLLPSGRVLVVGGLSKNNLVPTKSCELYDPVQNRWEVVDSIQNSSATEAAFIINNRELLLIGTNYQQQLVWEIYDYVEFKSKYVGYFNDGSFVNNKIQLQDGRILVSGGMKTQNYEAYLATKKCWMFDKNLTHVTETKDRENNDIFFQNYPNPFNGSTTIKFFVSKSSNVRITIYNILGEKVDDLINERKESGLYEVLFSNVNLPSGVYYCRITLENKTMTKKLLLIK